MAGAEQARVRVTTRTLSVNVLTGVYSSEVLHG